ncbi:hypothetical protein AA313_de0203655 [Arthrobotrys entomopaga]|nr:hypothetical protein AA313_de0203655 [Arthrobotrys entomopaga]
MTEPSCGRKRPFGLIPPFSVMLSFIKCIIFARWPSTSLRNASLFCFIPSRVLNSFTLEAVHVVGGGMEGAFPTRRNFRSRDCRSDLVMRLGAIVISMIQHGFRKS